MTGIAWNTIGLNTNLTDLRGLVFHTVDLKPPMDTYLHVSRREVNQNPVTKPGLKQGLVVMFWAPKIASEAITQHQIPKLFPGGACPQTPLASAWTLTLSLVPIRPTNATPSPLHSDYSSYTPDDTNTKIGTPPHMKAHNSA